MKFSDLADRIACSLNHSFVRLLDEGGEKLIEDRDQDKKVKYQLVLACKDEIHVTIEFKKRTPA